jgi:hypothetical protein
MAGLRCLPLSEFQVPVDAVAYRYRVWPYAISLVVFATFCLAMLYIGWIGGVQLNKRGDGILGFIGWAVGITWGLATWWVFGTQVKKRARPTAWLAMLTADGVYLKYRSYMNAHFPPEDRQIVFVPFAAIADARVHRRKWTVPTSRGRTMTQRATFVELRLKDPAETERLAGELAAERSNKGPRRKTWYGSAAPGRWGHDPLQVNDGHIAVTWGAHPDAQQFLTALADRVALSDPARTDYHWREHSSPETEAKAIRTLGRMGETFKVIDLLRRKLGLSLADAKARSEEIRRERWTTPAVHMIDHRPWRHREPGWPLA